jgi:hypothetical protein
MCYFSNNILKLELNLKNNAANFKPSLNLIYGQFEIRILLLFYSSFTLLIKFITLRDITPNIS